MFTGLIQDLGIIRNFARTGKVVQLAIQPALSLDDFQVGESIAVDGICLTVARVRSEDFILEVSPETLQRTTLGEGRPGSKVNLERALRLSERLGGHLVTGHVDGMGWIRGKQMGPGYLDLQIGIPTALDTYVVEKGSIAIDGISLTVNHCEKGRVDLALIPHTIENTTLAHKGVGDRINVECDILGKYVEKFLRERLTSGELEPSNITQEYLKEHGFL